MPGLKLVVDVSVDEEEETQMQFDSDRMLKTIEFDADEIMPKVFVGSLRATSRIEALRSNNIGRILNLSCRKARALEQQIDITQMTVNVLDSVEAKIIDHLDRCMNYIQDGLDLNQSVLICCSRGISRSVTVGAAFLMKSTGIGFKEALKSIQRLRPQAAPHFAFIGQLYVFEKNGYTGDIEPDTYKAHYQEFTTLVRPQDVDMSEGLDLQSSGIGADFIRSDEEEEILELDRR